MFLDIEHAQRGCQALPAPASYPGSVADPSTYRPRTGDIPTSPGVYRFSDPQNLNLDSGCVGEQYSKLLA